MSITRIISIITLAAGLLNAQPVSSPPIRIDAVPESSFLWCTVREVNPQINWSWPDGAKSARLTVKGGPAATNAVFESTEAPSFEWLAQLPDEDKHECVYSFSMEFYPESACGGQSITGAMLLVTGIGAVRGVGGMPFRLVNAVDESSAMFGRIPAKNVVLPIPGGGFELALNDEVPLELTGPSYFAWSDIAIGNHSAKLSGTVSLVRNLERLPAGLMLLLL